jgi:glutamate-1-semialdehyde 2,1-aminomutase
MVVRRARNLPGERVCSGREVSVVNFTRSRQLQERLRNLIPAGGHTYAKGPDQFPHESPGVLVRGSGCHVWDADGNEFIEYGMGLRAVTLGHAYPPVVEAVRNSLSLGTNFTRPAAIELECAERFLEIIDGAEMVKFTKDGSTADSAALKLARKYTGRDLVAICAEHPFFSYDDWFICTTTMDGGIPANVRRASPRSSPRIRAASRPSSSSPSEQPSRRRDFSRGCSRSVASTVPFSCSTR